MTNANHYEVARSSNNAPHSTAGTPAGTSFGDTGLTQGVTYVYKVRVIGPAGETSPYSNVAVATTIVLTNDPLQPNFTPIQIVHLMDGKVERLIQTLLREWAYRFTYQSSAERKQMAHSLHAFLQLSPSALFNRR